MILFRKISYAFLLLICITLFTGYEYKYEVEPLDATKNAINRNTNGIMYMEMGYYHAAENEFKIAISLVPNSPSSAAYYNNLGLLYLKINQYTKAEQCFLDAIDINPVFLEYYKNLVFTFSKMNVLDKKLRFYLDQIDNAPKNSNAYLFVGLIYMQKGNKELAAKYLKEYLKLEKDIVLARAIKQLLYEMR